MAPVSIEGMLQTYLLADPLLPLDATGGIYAYTGLRYQGISRETVPAAFQVGGYLLPLVVIKARSPIPVEGIGDLVEQKVAQNQMVEFWIYQWVGYDIIETLDNHIYRLVQGHKFPGYWPAEWDYTTGPERDMGSLKDASMIRVDYMFQKVRSVV